MLTGRCGMSSSAETATHPSPGRSAACCATVPRSAQATAYARSSVRSIAASTSACVGRGASCWASRRWPTSCSSRRGLRPPRKRSYEPRPVTARSARASANRVGASAAAPVSRAALTCSTAACASTSVGSRIAARARSAGISRYSAAASTSSGGAATGSPGSGRGGSGGGGGGPADRPARAPPCSPRTLRRAPERDNAPLAPRDAERGPRSDRGVVGPVRPGASSVVIRDPGASRSQRITSERSRRGQGSMVTLIAVPPVTAPMPSAKRSSGIVWVMRSATGTAPEAMYSSALRFWAGLEPFAPTTVSSR